MPRSRARRITLPRLALLAWLVFVVVASVGPFLISADQTIIGDRSGFDTIDVSIGGGAIVMKNGLWRGLGGGLWAHPSVHWHPGASNWIRFRFNRFLIGQDRLWGVSFPPWVVLIAPTLIALGTHRLLRHRARRTLTKLGRTPCPACGYDATGLEVCPECGAALGCSGGAVDRS